MHVTRFATLFLGSLLMSLPVVAQQLTPAAPRDAQAVNVLTRCLAAAGGTQAISAIQDFTGTGTITYFWAGQHVQGSVTTRGKGIDEFRLDANLPTGMRSWAVQDGAGSLKDSSGNVTAIPFANAVNLGALTVPILEVNAVLNDPAVAISYVGQVTLNGKQVYDIRIQRNFDSQTDPNGTLSKFRSRDFFIDSASFQIVETKDMTHPTDRTTDQYSHAVVFSDYQSIAGVLVPFSVTEEVTGQQTWTITLTSMNFNTGLTDSDFEL